MEITVFLVPFLQKWTILHICIWYKYILIHCLGIYHKMCPLVDYFHIFLRLKIVSQESGPIRKSLRNCSSLLRLRLERNQLSGNISEGFGTNPHLYYMDVSDNELHGELARKGERFNNLTTFRISGNKISGEIPAALGKTTHLQSVDLSSNQLVGRIPKELGNLKLTELELNDYKLSGDIPFDVTSLSDLERLGLAANNFSATILKQLGKCSKLIFLNMSENRFVKIAKFSEARREMKRSRENFCWTEKEEKLLFLPTLLHFFYIKLWLEACLCYLSKANKLFYQSNNTNNILTILFSNLLTCCRTRSFDIFTFPLNRRLGSAKHKIGTSNLYLYHQAWLSQQ